MSRNGLFPLAAQSANRSRTMLRPNSPSFCTLLLVRNFYRRTPFAGHLYLGALKICLSHSPLSSA